MLNLRRLFFVLSLLLLSQISFAQLGFSHEIGFIAGPLEFRSDFGVRNDEETNIGNMGVGIGLVHYINFAYRADCNCYTTNTYFSDHFKLRSEISWNRTSLQHFGEWIVEEKLDPNSKYYSIDAVKLDAHTGVAQNLDIGSQLEFFPLSIRTFQGYGFKYAPFISLGVHYTSYAPKAATEYGNKDINNPTNFYSYWDPESIDVSGGSTWSIVTSIGTRYKVGPLSDLMIDLRFQFYFNDWVDGLNHQYESNKFEDRLVWLNFGYIYYLD